MTKAKTDTKRENEAASVEKAVDEAATCLAFRWRDWVSFLSVCERVCTYQMAALRQAVKNDDLRKCHLRLKSISLKVVLCKTEHQPLIARSLSDSTLVDLRLITGMNKS